MNIFYKIIFGGLLLFFTLALSAQSSTPSIGEKLPTVIPPSPSVAALMKFEEVPVSNYTGTPDISIPLVLLPTKSSDITLNVALSYHPASAAGNSVAGNVGLGWSLVAGGTISRTVRGFPDDKFDGHTFGIRHQNNNYEEVLALENNHSSGINYDKFWKFLYETEHMNKYDSQYDIYQYNFMGRSGRFFLDKDYKVVQLENSTLKINYNITADEFIIYDEKGNSYLFNVKESTIQTSLTTITYFDHTTNAAESELPEYISAYHLKNITSKTGATVMEFNYGEQQIEAVKGVSTTFTQMTGPLGGEHIANLLNHTCWFDGVVQKLEPKKKVTGTTTNIKTRKLESIAIPDIAEIEFINELGRSDYNLNNSNASKLKQVVVKKYTTGNDLEETKRYVMGYTYSEGNLPKFGSRLLLKELKEISAGVSLKHSFEYKRDEKFANLDSDFIELDEWGYFKKSLFEVPSPDKASENFSANDMLQKIVLPTGGCRIFDFESHTYSYVGNQQLYDFKENDENWLYEFHEVPVYNSVPTDIPGLPSPVTIRFTAPIMSDHEALHLEQVDENGHVIATLPIRCDNGDCETIYTLNNTVLYDYRLKYVNFDTNSSNQNVSVPYYFVMTKLPPHEWLYGGGVRIRRIAYFENDTNKAYYDDPNVAAEYPGPAKEVNIGYQLHTDDLRSSGTLVTSKPVFKYYVNRTSDIGNCAHPPYGATQILNTYDYNVQTLTPSSPIMQTKGGNVGYQNVTVYETGKGRNAYVYTSPIDYTDPYLIRYPFQAPPSRDFKNGLLKQQKIYDQRSVLLKESVNTYNLEESPEIVSGLNIYTSQFHSCPWQSPNYESYMANVLDCTSDQANSWSCTFTCGTPDNFVSYDKVIDYIGWAKLSSTTTKEYLPKRDGTMSSVTSVEEYEYNPLNQQVSLYKKRVVGTPESEEERKEFTYYLPPNYLQNNRITEIRQIKSYEGNNLLANQVINYSETSPYLPENIASAKGTATPEQKVQFLSYDSFGRPREVKQPDGITISYIWGNTAMGPLAMIENADMTQIAQALNINLSMAMALSEISMTEINSLRQLLPNARVTTYTYKQLAGVETITDPRGATTTFSYDAFGRLEKVTDFEGHLLSANEYHYRTQN